MRGSHGVKTRIVRMVGLRRAVFVVLLLTERLASNSPCR